MTTSPIKPEGPVETALLEFVDHVRRMCDACEDGVRQRRAENKEPMDETRAPELVAKLAEGVFLMLARLTVECNIDNSDLKEEMAKMTAKKIMESMPGGSPEGGKPN